MTASLHGSRAAAGRALQRFEKKVKGATDRFSWYIYRINSRAMRDLFTRPGNPFRVREAVMSLLAGDVYGHSPILSEESLSAAGTKGRVLVRTRFRHAMNFAPSNCAPSSCGPASHVVLVPSYNTGARLFQTVASIRRQACPVWVVIDGSTDGTGEKLSRIAEHDPDLRVLVLPFNQGKGAAILHALRLAYGQGITHVVTIDADGQHSALEIGRFIDARS